ncbi:TRAP transporter large permease [Marinobacter salexigens]|uniref:TRAP transporter large permease protein n=1 Tax=Marinobacter salexigens TaxID=1925763 RepID=A0ABS6A5U9_9GAMM|nr:TRAP transporter large permease [Marinobacter salexigens]MBU2872557.1 TRAP transporter large permease [Marinobacter salexigens]
MEPVFIFYLVVISFAILMVAGTPIFASLGVASMLGIFIYGGISALGGIPDILYRGLSSYSLISIPLFILMGEVIARTSIGGKLFNAFILWLNRLPGNLAVASVGSSAVFGAMSGVSVAGAATIGRFAIPEMLKRGYAPTLASGTVAAAGALALLIPPSIGFVLYGEVAGQSIGRLFTAAVIPAILITGLMVLYVSVISNINPNAAPRVSRDVLWSQRFRAIADIWSAVLLILIVLGTIYFGITTPTEAAGLGAVGAFFIAGIFYRELSFAKVFEIFRSTAVTSGMIMLILIAALLFGYLLTRLMIPQQLVILVTELSLPAWATLILVVCFLLIIGMVLDIVSVIVITTPILLPLMISLGYDPIWFGVIIIISCEVAAITPPVGLNLYVIKGIAPSVSLNDIIRGAMPFVVLQIIAIIILALFPSLALWLPSMM